MAVSFLYNALICNCFLEKLNIKILIFIMNRLVFNIFIMNRLVFSIFPQMRRACER